jgi:DNA-binding FadR family transcriptional regulator
MARADRVSEVAGYLERAILEGRWAPGELLPSERELSADAGVSRSVVREAIGRLAGLGLVRSIHGAGTRVEAPNDRPIAAGYRRLLRRGEVDLRHLAAVRLPLETAIARLAAVHRRDEHLERLANAQEVLANARAGLEAHVGADLEFHAVLAEASGNPLFGIVLAPIQELLIESRRRTLGRHGAGIAHRHHTAILEAVRAGDPGTAEHAMRQHLVANYEHLAAETPPPRHR